MAFYCNVNPEMQPLLIVPGFKQASLLKASAQGTTGAPGHWRKETEVAGLANASIPSLQLTVPLNATAAWLDWEGMTGLLCNKPDTDSNLWFQ